MKVYYSYNDFYLPAIMSTQEEVSPILLSKTAEEVLLAELRAAWEKQDWNISSLDKLMSSIDQVYTI